LAEEGSGQGDALALASREPPTSVPGDGVEAVRQLAHEGLGRGHGQGLPHVGLGRFGLGPGEVGPDAFVEQERLLGHHGDRVTPAGDGVARERRAVDEDVS
jgi:hypothetical protein